MMKRESFCGGALLAFAASAGAAQSTSWVTRLGTDTVAIEHVARTRDRLEGDLVTFSPRTRINHYVVRFGPDGSVVGYELTGKPAVEGPSAGPVVSASIKMSPSGISGVVRRGEKADSVKLEGANVVPAMFLSWGLLGFAAERALEAGNRGEVDQYSVGAPRLTKTSIERRGDSVAVDFFGSPIMVAVDGAGRFLSVNGGATTVKVFGTRVSDLDLAAITESFAARDRAGHPTGALSVRDTARATVGGAELVVDYGRPAKRGREIWGTVVPFDAVWRTGANAATQLSTTKPLELGNLTLPAGTYTLWTIPGRSAVSLIVNRQTRQWGTEYDAAQDLGRVAARVERSDAPVERFTISVVPVGDGGELRFEWDRLRYVVPFKVKG
jgi:hypothetical protein